MTAAPLSQSAVQYIQLHIYFLYIVTRVAGGTDGVATYLCASLECCSSSPAGGVHLPACRYPTVEWLERTEPKREFR